MATVSSRTGRITVVSGTIGTKVDGPSSSTDNAVVRFDGTDGKTLQDSGVTIDDSDNLVMPGSYIEIGDSTQPSTPGAAITRLWVEDVDGHSALKLIDDEGVAVNLTAQSTITVRNDTGAQLDTGTAVFITGATGSRPQVDKADSSDPTKMPAIGLLLDDVPDNSTGRCITSGPVEFDTSAFNEGDGLYVSASTPGELTATQPAHPNLSQELASVVVSGVGNGKAVVFANGVDGNEQGTQRTTWNVGDDATATITVAYGASGGTGSMSWTPTAARTLTLPDETGTMFSTGSSAIYTSNAAVSESGSLAWAGGQRAAAGDAQGQLLTWHGTTEDGNQTEIFVDGSTERLAIAAGETRVFQALIGFQTNPDDTPADPDVGGWRFEGVIERSGNGTTAIAGSLDKTVIVNDLSGDMVDATIEADDSNDAIVIKVTGKAATTLYWTASMHVLHVG